MGRASFRHDALRAAAEAEAKAKAEADAKAQREAAVEAEEARKKEAADAAAEAEAKAKAEADAKAAGGSEGEGKPEPERLTESADDLDAIEDLAELGEIAKSLGIVVGNKQHKSVRKLIRDARAAALEAAK